ncbi:hypothetical protein [Spirosoma aerophilum]
MARLFTYREVGQVGFTCLTNTPVAEGKGSTPCFQYIKARLRSDGAPFYQQTKYHKIIYHPKAQHYTN